MSRTPAYDALSEQHQLFVDYYIDCYNATNAAIKAGYSRNGVQQAASRLHRRDDIQAAITEQLDELKRTLKITPERILRELSDIAFSDIESFLEIEAGKVTVKDLKEIKKASLASATEKIAADGTKTIQLKFHKKDKALELLSRNQGMLNDKLDVGGDLANAILAARLRAKGDDEQRDDLSFLD